MVQERERWWGGPKLPKTRDGFLMLPAKVACRQLQMTLETQGRKTDSRQMKTYFFQLSQLCLQTHPSIASTFSISCNTKTQPLYQQHISNTWECTSPLISQKTSTSITESQRQLEKWVDYTTSSKTNSLN